MSERNQNDYDGKNPPPESAANPFEAQGDGRHIYPPVISNYNRGCSDPVRYGERDGFPPQPGQHHQGAAEPFSGNRFNPEYSRGGYKSPDPLRGEYRYNPESGWQRSGTFLRGGKYEWNFRDYEELDVKNREGGKKSKGVLVFALCLVCVVLISVACMTGYTIISGAGEGVPNGLLEAPSSAIMPGRGGGASSDSPYGGNVQIELWNKPSSGGQALSGDRLTIPQIAKEVTPSVVGVSAFQGSRYYDPVSMGSGIIMSADGYIVTNAHVVMGSTKFKVQLYDNRPFDAVLIGLDASTDLAVLKITAEDLAPAAFGNSEEIEVGEMVVAIGNPSGSELAGSVTSGIISAVNRRVTTGSYSFTYIQTDAAINPGNSGGALVNEYGQVIGINSSKIVATGYEGIGFAIPITDAKPILDDIIAYGKVTGRVMLGITCIPVGDVDAKNYGIPPGLEIQEVSPNSDIANYDVQSGDILTHIGGTPVYTQSDVQAILKDYQVGDKVTLRFFRRIPAVEDINFEITVFLIEN